ncbi:MAG TPA: N-acetylmuramoyl-L-alanine amidase [Clostridia bacterium]|nr:N-acetylmuramoyl-L-alanine amidase [Clostridia bacterium]
MLSFVFTVVFAVMIFSSLNEYEKDYIQIPDGSLKDILIVIDPGHGGVDGGASLDEHFNEKDINLDISLKLKRLLINDGARVVLTRESDVSLEKRSELQLSRYKRDLDGRRRIINESKADIFVSIHSNCFRSSPQTKGALIFYYSDSVKGKKLAQFISNSIDEILYRNFLGNYKLASKVLTKDLYILRNTEIPGVLVEVGYMTNREEGRLLRQDDFQAAMAGAIHDGLKKYFLMDIN